MAFLVEGVIQVKGDKAKVVVKEFGDEVKKAGGKAGDFAGKGKGASDTAQEIAKQSREAAQTSGLLVAQYNDLLVTIAAGQDPRQIAIQQGTQITQVMGNRGAAGSLKLLKDGLLAAISPMNLVTIATIAAGAAFIQWITRADEVEEKAETLQEKLARVADAQKSLNEEIRKASFGASSEELILLDAIEAKTRAIASLEEGRNARRFQNNSGEIDRQQEALAEERNLLVEQLAQLRQMEAQRETLTQSAAEMTDAERLIGEQMSVTGAELQRNEAIAQLLKEGYSASLIEALQLAGVDISSPISTAASEAARLAQNLGIAYEEAVALNAQRNQPYVSSGRGGDPRVFDSGNRLGNVFVPTPGAVTRADELLNPRRRRGGGTSDIERQQKAVDDLVASLTRQRDIIRETDPVQKEMIQNRKILANATKAERAEVEELIATRIREEAAIDAATERADFYGSVLSDALSSASKEGAKLDDILKRVASSFIDAGIQAAIFGTGPFGNLFGGIGIFGGGTGPDPQALAEGGMVYGAGGPRADKQVVLASPGEFMVNANATARHRALLEQINSGAPISRLANGGPIGGGALPPVGGAGQTPINLNVYVQGAVGNTEIEELSNRGATRALEEYDQLVLPGRVSEISQNPRIVG